MVGDGVKVDELLRQASGEVADGEVVEAAPAAVEKEDLVPHGRVELVATARGEAQREALTFGDGLKLAVEHVAFHIQGDGTGTGVGIEVDGNSPAVPLV